MGRKNHESFLEMIGLTDPGVPAPVVAEEQPLARQSMLRSSQLSSVSVSGQSVTEPMSAGSGFEAHAEEFSPSPSEEQSRGATEWHLSPQESADFDLNAALEVSQITRTKNIPAPASSSQSDVENTAIYSHHEIPSNEEQDSGRS